MRQKKRQDPRRFDIDRCVWRIRDETERGLCQDVRSEGKDVWFGKRKRPARRWILHGFNGNEPSRPVPATKTKPVFIADRGKKWHMNGFVGIESWLESS